MELIEKIQEKKKEIEKIQEKKLEIEKEIKNLEEELLKTLKEKKVEEAVEGNVKVTILSKTTFKYDAKKFPINNETKKVILEYITENEKNGGGLKPTAEVGFKKFCEDKNIDTTIFYNKETKEQLKFTELKSTEEEMDY